MYPGLTPRAITITVVVLYFGGHMINTGWEAYRCEQMLAAEEINDDRNKYINSTNPHNNKYKFNCKIPMYGLEWVYVEEEEDD